MQTRIQSFDEKLNGSDFNVNEPFHKIHSVDKKPSFRSPLAYGTRDGKDQTSYLVETAILEGFRHIVTGSHHIKHNETGVGIGWKSAVKRDPTIRRNDLFLQTMFVPWDGKDFKPHANDPVNKPSIEEQVEITISQSLQNLQTDYIDSVLYFNFRAELHAYEDMIRAWRVLEQYVEKGTIRFLGLSNIHDADYLTRLQNDAKIKVSIVQNRFHANRGFDISLTPFFDSFGIQVQRFWILTGNGGGVKRNNEMAKDKKLTPEQLMLAFVMTLGSEGHSTTALVGTHNVEHMREDIEVAYKYEHIFKKMDSSDLERMEFATNIGMKYIPETSASNKK